MRGQLVPKQERTDRAITTGYSIRFPMASKKVLLTSLFTFIFILDFQSSNGYLDFIQGLLRF